MAPVVISDSALQFWTEIDSGGFGKIYKAKYNDLGMQVAVKILHHDDSLSLRKEAERMQLGGSPFVLRVLGMFEGVPPGRRGPPQRGMVMEFMERGSVEFLLQRLKAPPPWPLAFRLCHQVALGMNYLHRLVPPLLHLDLKPSNVLLDDGLGVKLTDFGLARFVHTVSSVGQKEAAGTLSYLPPEAFSLQTYKPSPASDSYSYAMFLWSVITGKQPYSGVLSCIIMYKVPQGDRPSLELLDRSGVEGLGEIADLMVQCWDPSPENRPLFHDCLPVTEKVFELHKLGIKDALFQVMTSLDSKGETWRAANPEQEEDASCTQPNVKEVHIPEPKTREDFLKFSCPLTLDPNTAYRELHLSEGNREVTRVRQDQPYPDHPERFDRWAQVLCREGLSERCYWEAEWSGGGLGVYISVSYKEISRKGRGNDCALGCNDKSWSLFCSPSNCWFSHNNKSTDLPAPPSSRIGVYLDQGAGTLSFYSVSDPMTLLHRVQTTFTQPLHPGFLVYYDSSVKLCDLG